MPSRAQAMAIAQEGPSCLPLRGCWAMSSRAPTAADATGAAVGSGLLPAPLGAEGLARKRFAAATVVVWRRRFGKPVGRKGTILAPALLLLPLASERCRQPCAWRRRALLVLISSRIDAGALSFAARYGKARRWPQIQEHRNPCMKLP